MHTDLQSYMICSPSKGRRKYSCQNYLDNYLDNDEISKYTKILNKKEQDNEKETNNTVNIDVKMKDQNRRKRN